LPLRAEGASLERLVVPALDKPEELTALRLDASAGLDGPVPAHADYILRGDAANDYRERLADMSREDMADYLRDYWRKEYYWIDIATVDATYDERTGEEHISMDGIAKMDWKGGGAEDKRYESEGAALGWKPDYHRDPGPNQDTPFAARYPYFVKNIETVLLPAEGKGFSIEGDNIDTTIAGREFKRTAKIENGAFTVEASTRAVATEFPAADAAKINKDLRDMSEYAIYLCAPKMIAKVGTADLPSIKTPEDGQADPAVVRAIDAKTGAQAADHGAKQ
jgi:hypothetical protein